MEQELKAFPWFAFGYWGTVLCCNSEEARPSALLAPGLPVKFVWDLRICDSSSQLGEGPFYHQTEILVEVLAELKLCGSGIPADAEAVSNLKLAIARYLTVHSQNVVPLSAAQLGNRMKAEKQFPDSAIDMGRQK